MNTADARSTQRLYDDMPNFQCPVVAASKNAAILDISPPIPVPKPIKSKPLERPSLAAHSA